MRKTAAFVIIIFGMILFLTGCVYQISFTSNQDDYGEPYKIHIPSLPDDQTWVSFGIISDTHIDASYAGYVPFHNHDYRDTNNVKNNRKTISELNKESIKDGCHGVIHIGDVGDDNNLQNLVAFRQLYEDSYPGYDGGAIAGASDDDFDAYSQGYRIAKGVFPTLGNHDAPPYNDDPVYYYKVAEYINDRIIGAHGLASSFNKVAYAWRWGKYYFIVLGLWAGSYEHESSTDICYAKLEWLEDFLEENVGDSGLGVLLFQHYGWDGFSKEDRWWTEEMRSLEIDVLMRRPLGSGDSVKGKPYNILGIFTGHTHEKEHREVYAGKNLDGDDVYFDNYIVDDAGTDNDHYGFSIVTLKGTEMEIKSKDVATNSWEIYSKPIHLGP